MSFIFINGHYAKEISNPGALLNCISVDGETFTLHLPTNFRSNELIYFFHAYTDLASKSLKQIIIAEEGCDVSIVETYKGRSNVTYVSKSETEVHLKPNARLHFYKWQQDGDQATHSARFIAKQARDSYLGTYHVAQGSKISHDYFSYALMGEGATCESIGFYQAANHQELDVQSHIQHKSSHTNSRQLYKGIADDYSLVRFNGMVMVDPGMKEICAHQRNNNLLLSSQAQVDTQPALEIYSEDVRCSHGATVGQLDNDWLFYLRSRGIDEPMAHSLLTSGFANEVFSTFPDVNLARIMRGTG